MAHPNTLRVLELGNSVAAAYCAQMLYGFGAEVWRIESPQAARREYMTANEHAWFHAGKRTLDFDWSADDAAAQLSELIARYDIVLDGCGVGVLTTYGLEPDGFSERWPSAVLCQITPFGSHGPAAGNIANDIVLHAASGMMQSTGNGSREPLNPGPRIAQLLGGLHAYAACQMALLRRAREGGGDVVEISLQESTMEAIETIITEHLHLGKLPRRNGDEHSLVPWRTYDCADGEVAVIGGPIRRWLDAAEMFEQAELLTPPLDHIGGRIDKRAYFESLIKPWLLRHTRRELFEAGQRKGLAWGFVATLPEVLDDPQLAARGFFVEIDQPGLGKIRKPGAPFRGPRVQWRDAPASLRAEPLTAALTAPPLPAGAKTSATRKALPLAGIRVADFTHDWAGPHGTRLLADYGAEVVKIEFPGLLDTARGAYMDRINGHPRVWHLSRNKRSLALDLRRPADLRVCESIIAECDLVIENSRPGVKEKLGLGWDRLRELRSDIILLSMSGFGKTGPQAHYAGYGANLEGLSGVQSLTGYRDAARRYRIREMDVLNGMMGVCATMNALLDRQSSGQGQWIDLSELETSAWLVGEHLLNSSRTGTPGPVLGNRHGRYAPQGCYRCAGEDRWLVLSIEDDAQWQRFAAMSGDPTLREARFARAADRQSAHDELDERIGNWTRDQDARALAQALQMQQIPASMVFNAADIAGDPHLQARKWLLETPAGRFPGFPFTLRRGGAAWRSKGPDFGEYNHEAFARVGLAEAEPDLSPSQLHSAYEPR